MMSSSSTQRTTTMLPRILLGKAGFLGNIHAIELLLTGSQHRTIRHGQRLGPSDAVQPQHHSRANDFMHGDLLKFRSCSTDGTYLREHGWIRSVCLSLQPISDCHQNQAASTYQPALLQTRLSLTQILSTVTSSVYTRPQMTGIHRKKTRRYADECMMSSVRSTATSHALWVYLAVSAAWAMSEPPSMRHTWGNLRCCWPLMQIWIFLTLWATRERPSTLSRHRRGLKPLQSWVPGKCRSSIMHLTDGCKIIPLSPRLPTMSCPLVQSKSPFTPYPFNFYILTAIVIDPNSSSDTRSALSVWRCIPRSYTLLHSPKKYTARSPTHTDRNAWKQPSVLSGPHKRWTIAGCWMRHGA
jgi:hypothetical protein